ncbi:MAG TPA: hypothetical protein VMV19_15845 [Xanthobacteraceae bacterium]|nr:hypothetical protein [Xanthobacteraceae bacterium]
MEPVGPWTFGWTQLLTIVGFAITGIVAFGGFRTFDRWKREKLEERRIEIAFEALSIAYEAKFVFDSIRSPMAFAHEWSDMPRSSGESDDDWSHRGSFFAILKRIANNKDYLERVWKLQPRFMAEFGPQTEQIFLKLHQARKFIETSAQMLARRRDDDRGQWNENRQRQRDQWEADIWIGMDAINPGNGRVGQLLNGFKTEIESLCRPITERNYRRK